MQYVLSQTHYFRETGAKVEAGDTVELTKEQADAANAAHPGLLRLARLNTQAHPKVIRKATKPARHPRARRSRARR